MEYVLYYNCWNGFVDIIPVRSRFIEMGHLSNISLEQPLHLLYSAATLKNICESPLSLTPSASNVEDGRHVPLNTVDVLRSSSLQVDFNLERTKGHWKRNLANTDCVSDRHYKTCRQYLIKGFGYHDGKTNCLFKVQTSSSLLWVTSSIVPRCLTFPEQTIRYNIQH